MTGDSVSPLSIKAVMAAMADFAEAKGDHDVAFANYGGMSWGYHGRSYLEAVEQAEDKAESVLKQYIEHCVAQALAKVLP